MPDSFFQRLKSIWAVLQPPLTVHATNKGKSFLGGIARAWPNVTMMFDVSSLSPDLTEKVTRMLEGEIQLHQHDAPDEHLYVLHVWAESAEASYLRPHVYCIYARVGADQMRVTLREFSRPDVFAKRLSWDTSLAAFDACSFAEFEFHMPKWDTDVCLTPDQADAGAMEAYRTALTSSWECLLRIRPSHREQIPLYTAEFDLPFDELSPAKKYWQTKLVYKLFEPIGTGGEASVRLQTWTATTLKNGTESRKIRKIDGFPALPTSKDDFAQRIRSIFDSDQWDILCGVCNRIIYIDDPSTQFRGGVGASGDCRELHVIAPKDRQQKPELAFKIFSYYNGNPYEGGRMAGYTYSQTITIPLEQMTWDDRKLWDTYLPGFMEARKSAAARQS